ncbi:DUF2975 domain-containing protein [Xenorhabdus kozodoii]|uniref:DUF2975 domain-containing protein n=1 Tax=Xenorhabdus kozodoii TaxID=351676 RepID=UPI000C03B372
MISTIPLLSLIGRFFAFHRLFGNYRKGDYFSKRTVKYLEYAGWGVILWSILDIFCEPIPYGFQDAARRQGNEPPGA